MNRRTSLTLGAAAGGLLASAFLPVAAAFADPGTVVDTATGTTSSFPTEPGTDAFTIGSTTFDPYQGTTLLGDPTNEGFNAVTEGTGTSPFFETGSAVQPLEVYQMTSGSTSPTDLGSILANENVTNFGSITNTGYDFTGDTLVPLGASTAGLPTDGTVYDVTNFGSGYENVYTDVPGAAGGAGTVTDTFVTPFGDDNLSSLVSAFDLTSLDPGAAFGVGSDAASAAADAVGSVDPLSFLGL